MISDRSSRMRAIEFREEDGAGLLDLHSFDDTDLLFQDAMAERIESSPFIPFTETYAGMYDNDMDVLWSTNKPPGTKQRIGTESSPMRAVLIDKESNGKDSGLARIKVVVRKRPLNKKEISRKEEDIISIDERGCSLTIHEPKLKVDLTAYVEKHDFVFDAVLSQHVTNDEVYSVTVEPIIPTIFQNTKATCFAFGQTGSGKTYTMQPLPLRACRDILNMMRHPSYKDQGLQLWFSFFEIYGGKLYDLLNDRRKLCMREDGRQQVCIVDLKEYPVSDLQFVKDYIEKGNATRSTGSTGANEESSRSHAILQLVLKKHHSSTSGKGERRGRLIGKFSFIDLAGSERGADTTDNDRQTRIEGAEINKSLLALKECIRALDLDQGHIPFRGSKLTEVLRDSFVGNSRTIMISCISPNSGSCEHTLNTLRYADRVKGLSKSSNARRDASPITTVAPSIGAPTQCHPSPSLLTPLEITMEWRNGESIRHRPEHGDFEDQSIASSHHIPQQRSFKDTTFDKRGSSSLKDQQGTDDKVSAYQRRPIYEESTINMVQSRLKEPVDSSSLHNGYERQITAILEEEEDLISAHRLEVEDSMDLVQQEMKLLSEIDQPGSRIDRYVSQLIYSLSRKAAGIMNLQARLTRFQQHLKEQEILSYNSG